MAVEKKVVHLNIFLIKNQYDSADEIINVQASSQAIEIPISGYGISHLFIKQTSPHPPKWAALFQDFIDTNKLSVPGVGAALLIKVKQKNFVLAFGQSGRFLLKDDVFEERFGLLCALNSVDPESFRCVDVQSLDAIESHTRIQSGQDTTSDQFGLDVEQDMLKAIVGTPMNHTLGSRMTGSDSLSVSVKLDLSDLPVLLDAYRNNFEADLNAQIHQWVNNISMTKSTSVIDKLEIELNNRLAAGRLEGIWLAIPEIIEWTKVQGFTYTRGRKAVHPDINLSGFLKSVKSGIPLTLELMRERIVYCVDEDFNKVKHWSVFKCLYAELEIGADKYLLNDGKWFHVATDFVAKTNIDFAKIPHSKLTLPKYQGGGEGKYNQSIAASQPDKFALLDDTKKVMHGGGHGQVEICDLLSIDRDLIHVKMYGKSAVLSHLFAQGFVSGQLIQIDPEFRKKVINQLESPFADLIKVDRKPNSDEFTIVYAVISEAEGDQLYLPFFSRVNLINTAKILKGFGYKVELLKIHVDENYAKTIKLPPA